MTNSLRSALVALALAAAVAAPRAEVSVNGHGEHLFFQTEPGETWAPHRNGGEPEHLLNPFGDARGDGAPAIERNPVTGAWEVVWGRAGETPGVVFAHFDVEADAWVVRDVTRNVVVDRWAGRTLAFVHDDFGNRFVGFHDPLTGAVLLASAPRDTFQINRPIIVSTVGVRGSMPALHWDGEVVVIAYARPDGGLDIVHLRPDIDDQGRIPNAGIGIPGIPDLQVSVEPGGGALHPLSVGGVGGAPIGWPGGPEPDDAADGEIDVPPMVRIEAVWGDRLLVTWLESPTELGYVGRIAGEWSFAGTIVLDSPLDHEAARVEAQRMLTGSGRARGR